MAIKHDTTEQWRLHTYIFRAYEKGDTVMAESLKETYRIIYGWDGLADPPCMQRGCEDLCTKPMGGLMFHCEKHSAEILKGL